MKVWKLEGGELKCTTSQLEKNDSNVTIEVKAIGLNRADILQMQGLYPSPDGSNVPGLEVSGVVSETGEKVCALLPSGGYATHVSVDRRLVMPIPSGFSFEEAAALPEVLITSYLNLFEIAGLQKEQSILIHGATSGVGSFAMRCAEEIGATVYATTGKDTAEYLNYNADWGDLKVDVLLDILGGQFVNRNISALKANGVYVSIAVMQGSKAEINMAAVLMKNIKIIGSTLRSKSIEQKAEMIKKAFEFISKHPIKPIIDSVHDFNAMPAAIKRLEDRAHVGKVVVRCNV